MPRDSRSVRRSSPKLPISNQKRDTESSRNSTFTINRPLPSVKANCWFSFYFHLPGEPKRELAVCAHRPNGPRRQAVVKLLPGVHSSRLETRSEPKVLPVQAVTLKRRVFCSVLPAGAMPGMNKLVLANLLHRPLRAIISVLAVAIEVVMILSIVAIFMGMLDDQRERTNGIGADIVVMPSNASFMNGVGGAPMSAKLADVFRRLPHVTVVAPAITNFSMSGSVEILYGIDYASYNALKPFVFLSGGPFQGPFNVIVDDVFASEGHGHHVGETITILNHPFRISGIVESGKGGRKLIPIDTMGAQTGSEGKASEFYLKTDNPANDKLVIDEIHSTPGLQNYRVLTMSDLIALYTPSHFPGFDLALRVDRK